jgi:hypothetical protein
MDVVTYNMTIFPLSLISSFFKFIFRLRFHLRLRTVITQIVTFQLGSIFIVKFNFRQNILLALVLVTRFLLHGFQRLSGCCRIFLPLLNLFLLKGISSSQRTNSLHNDPAPTCDVPLPACSNRHNIFPVSHPYRDLTGTTSLINLEDRFAFRSENASESITLG